MTREDDGTGRSNSNATFRGGNEMEDGQAKREWTAPTLTVYGDVEEITQGCDKTYGSSDSFTFQGQAIVCAGS